MANNPNSLEGKVALVIGASSGIGEGIVEAIAECHPKAIVIAARRIELLQQITKRMQSRHGTETYPIQTDVTIPKDLDNLFQKSLERYGRIDIIVNSAGIIQKNNEPLETMSDERIKAITDTNLTAAEYIAKRVIPIFKNQKSGIYLVITSEAAEINYDNCEPYCASKAGANRLIGSLNATFRLLEKKSVRAYAFALGPGLIDTKEAKINFPNTPENVWKKAGTPLQFARKSVIPALIDPEKYLSKYSPIRTIKTANAEDVK